MKATLVIETNNGRRYTCHNRKDLNSIKNWLTEKGIEFHTRQQEMPTTKFNDQTETQLPDEVPFT
jgi:hypothetical protein